jgi:hypothetical protein
MDEVLGEMIRDAEADPGTVALILHGSRAVGHERPDSDYDMYRMTANGLGELRVSDPSWFTDGLVQGRVLVDKTDGELEVILERLGAAHNVERPYDGYLNAFVRSKAAARRGDELGARLHAADSVRYLVEALAALEGRRPRFHDRLAGNLGEWESRLLAILRDPDVDAQRALQRDVQALMASRGVRAHEGWEPSQLR